MIASVALSVASLFAGAASFNPYMDYCAHPPLPQRASFPGPLPADMLASKGLELAGVNVILRHGPRNAIHDPNACMNSELAKQIGSRCHVTERYSVGISNASFVTPGVLSAMPLVEEFHDGKRDEDCGPAQLLDDAIPIFESLAAAMRSAYFTQLKRPPTLDDTFLYSTDLPRTRGTVFLMQQYLFGASAGMTSKTINTRPIDEDAWAHRAPCPRAEEALKNYVAAGDGEPEGYKSFAKLWESSFGKPWVDSCHDPLLVANCTGVLPDAMRAMLPTITRMHYSRVREKYERTKEWATLLVAPAWLEFIDMASRMLSEDNYTLALWGTHDTVVIPLLMALDAWDGLWPHYGEVTMLEVYRSKSRKGYVRLLRRGRPVDIPSCKQGPLGLCELDKFLPDSLAKQRDKRIRHNLCQAPAINDMAASTSTMDKTMGLSPLMTLVSLLIAFSGGFLLGRGRQRSSLNNASMNASPLLA
eukprot:TRINITY_DN18411_c0_g1_i1.p1 TRINITY_DN18411_c0_g1~~TRINITY_DN18411_c0_g1_i1.p1  ORF type:complete len:473 (-),score=16.87 TRINITY_DN18411_c0_g1_i1:98-1516(-)